jgi:uncharacterized protein YndB with AHSA1/START domain
METTFSTVSDLELAATRVFNAPREAVYRAYTDPEAVQQWWGLRSTTTVVDRMDVRPGGTWRYIQRDDQGNEYAFNGEYLEIVPNEKIVNTFEFEPMPGHVIIDTAIFEDIEGGTRLTVTSRFQSVEDLTGMLESGMEEGANESWDMLAEYLASAR